MKIIPIPAFSDNYIWAICDPEAGVFDCVDPGDAKPVLNFAAENQLDLRTVLITHHHHDHIDGIAELIKKFPNCIVYGPVDARIPNINYQVKADQIIQLGALYFQILFNPGHTATHISYYEPKKGWLFCGDTLFSAGCGRVFDGTLEELHQSMQLFKSLPSATKIFCAHEYTLQNLNFAKTVEPMNLSVQNYIKKLVQESIQCSLPSTLSTELLINPFLRTNIPEVQEFARLHGALSNDSFAIFSVLRKEKNGSSNSTKTPVLSKKKSKNQGRV